MPHDHDPDLPAMLLTAIQERGSYVCGFDNEMVVFQQAQHDADGWLRLIWHEGSPWRQHALWPLLRDHGLTVRVESIKWVTRAPA